MKLVVGHSGSLWVAHSKMDFIRLCWICSHSWWKPVAESELKSFNTLTFSHAFVYVLTIYTPQSQLPHLLQSTLTKFQKLRRYRNHYLAPVFFDLFVPLPGIKPNCISSTLPICPILLSSTFSTIFFACSMNFTPLFTPVPYQASINKGLPIRLGSILLKTPRRVDQVWQINFKRLWRLA